MPDWLFRPNALAQRTSRLRRSAHTAGAFRRTEVLIEISGRLVRGYLAKS